MTFKFTANEKRVTCVTRPFFPPVFTFAVFNMSKRSHVHIVSSLSYTTNGILKDNFTSFL